MPLSCLCSFVGPFFRLLCWRLKSPVDFVPIEFHSAMRWNQVLVLSKKNATPCKSGGQGFVSMEALLQDWFLPARNVPSFPTCKVWEISLYLPAQPAGAEWDFQRALTFQLSHQELFSSGLFECFVFLLSCRLDFEEWHIFVVVGEPAVSS